jgi:hypothetical protein
LSSFDSTNKEEVPTEEETFTGPAEDELSLDTEMEDNASIEEGTSVGETSIENAKQLAQEMAQKSWQETL